MIKSLSRHNKRAVIEVGERWVKLCVLEERHGQPRITDAYAVKTNGSEEGAASILKLIHQKLGSSRVDYISVFPRKLLMAKYLKLPSQNQAEIKELVKFQATRSSPYAQDEVVTNHVTLAKEADGYSGVMVFIAPKSQIKKHVETFSGSGITLSAIAMDIEGALHYLLHKKEIEQGLKGAAAAVLDVDLPYVNFMVLANNEVVFSRSISYAKTFVETIDEVAKVGSLDILVDELRRSLAAFQKEDNAVPVSKLLISGRWYSTDMLKERLAGSLNMPVEIVPFLKDIPVEESLAAQLVAKYEGEPISFASAMGTALYAERFLVNLLPAELKVQKHRRVFRKELITTAALVGAILFLGVTMLIKGVFDRKASLRAINSKVSALEPDVQRIEDVRRKLGIMQLHERDKVIPAQILKEVYTIIPANVSLVMFTYDKDEGVILRGTSTNMPDVMKLSESLEKSDYFRHVEIKYISERMTSNGMVVDFQIRCPMEVR